MSPATRPTHPAAFALPGLAAVIGLHALFVVTWDVLFAKPPWPGYEESARLGMIEPWFVNSPRSLWLTRIVLFTLAFGVVLSVRRRRAARVLALWIGVAAGVALTWATTTSSAFDGGTAGFFFYPLRAGLPIVVGGTAAALVHRFGAGRAS
ncbi:MAG TPA: hypothetical protein VMM79_01570 [Longimicrobiales bacterium]|nr:hypothetical protein [Longimicrobiales bacterium]